MSDEPQEYHVKDLRGDFHRWAFGRGFIAKEVRRGSKILDPWLVQEMAKSYMPKDCTFRVDAFIRALFPKDNSEPSYVVTKTQIDSLVLKVLVEQKSGEQLSGLKEYTDLFNKVIED